MVQLVPTPRPRIPDLANWSPNPRLINDAFDWIAFDGASNQPVARGTNQSVGGLSGVAVAYYDWTAPGNGGGGIYTPNAQFGAPGANGQRVYYSVFVWVDKAQTLALRAIYDNGDTADLGGNVAVPAQQWVQLRGDAVPPAGATGARIFAHGGSRSWAAGDRMIATLHCQTIGQPATDYYFDGSSVAFGGYTFTWGGAVGSSVSYRTILSPAAISTPWGILGWDSTRDTLNVVHQLLGGNVVAVVGGYTSRAGTLKLLFLTRADAWLCEQLHAQPATWGYSDPDNPETSMGYVVNGPVRIYQDETRKRWVCEIPFRELL